MSVPETVGLRKAALTLHALPSADRQKVWSRLDETQRNCLSPLLEELQVLGIPQGRQWLPDDVSVPVSVRKGGAPLDVQQMRARLWRLSPDEAIVLLAGQSIDTVAAVLTVADWPWAAEVVSHWPADQRHALRIRMDVKRQWPPKLAAQLLHSFWTRLGTAPVTGAAAGKLKVVARRPWYRAVMSVFVPT